MTDGSGFACRRERHPHAREIMVRRLNVDRGEIVYQSRYYTVLRIACWSRILF